jgi:hypothetical protein
MKTFWIVFILSFMAAFINSRSLLMEIDDEAAEAEDKTDEIGQDYADDDYHDTYSDDSDSGSGKMVIDEWFTDLLKNLVINESKLCSIIMKLTP